MKMQPDFWPRCGVGVSVGSMGNLEQHCQEETTSKLPGQSLSYDRTQSRKPQLPSFDSWETS